MLPELAQVLLAALVATLMLAGIGMLFGWGWLPKGCNRNYLCENKYTRAIDPTREDRWEATHFPCKLEDCCYNVARAESVCKEYATRLGEDPGELCSDLTQKNPATWFDCAESTTICNDEKCVESCDHDGECEEGEVRLCADCW